MYYVCMSTCFFRGVDIHMYTFLEMIVFLFASGIAVSEQAFTMCVCVCVCVFMCVFVCVCVCVCVYVYTYI